MIIYSTLPGFVSFRNPNEGSPFIRVLCHFLQPEFARNHDLKSILQFVSHAIKRWHIPSGIPIQSQSFDQNHETMNYVTQVPEYTSELSKDVYFDVKDNGKIFIISMSDLVHNNI